ncbi:MAG: hypothetical protein WCB53_04915 [Terriglobales bacterium]
MKRAAFVVSLIVVLSVGVLAQDSPNFSGTYHLVSIKADNPAKKLPASTLTIVHREGIMERTEVTDGKSLVSRYTLDGKECKNVTSGGVSSTDRAELKGKNIIIRSIVPLNAPPPAASSAITTEKWELSKDSTTLTIHSKVEFPGVAMLDFSSTEVYSRER